MAKDGTAPDDYCAIGDTEPAWCAHCRDAEKGLSATERAARDKSIPPPNASIGWSSQPAVAASSEPDSRNLKKTWIWYDSPR